MKSMRAAWRLVRILWTVLIHTAYLAITVRWRPRAARAAYRAWRMHRGCRAICRVLGIRVRVEGEVPGAEGVLLVCNHFGVLDPFVLASCMPLAPAAKAEVAGWPFIGWVCRTMGVFFVARDQRAQTGAFVDTVQDRLHHGVHVLVFPEGTTTAERHVRPFKTGAFEAVAGMADGLVLPLYLDADAVEGLPAEGAQRRRVVWADTHQPFHAHVWQLLGLREVEMCIRIGRPLPTAGYDRKKLAQISHAVVHRLCAERQPV